MDGDEIAALHVGRIGAMQLGMVRTDSVDLAASRVALRDGTAVAAAR